MKKTVIILIAIVILTMGAVTAVYAADNSSLNNSGCGSSMMHQNNGTYNSMIDMMTKNGFESAAQAMENRDFDAMNDFMNNITNEQYNQMNEMMKNNGYDGMANMMNSISKEDMINMRNSMMGR
jgi:hypothetical protein